MILFVGALFILLQSCVQCGYTGTTNEPTAKSVSGVNELDGLAHFVKGRESRPTYL